MNSATTKQTVKIDKMDIHGMLAYPVGTVFELPDGNMHRVATTRMRNCRVITRMTKRTANGIELKAGEEAILLATEPQVWRKGSF
jgi:hypothetical protein